jgi:hypothetical protein
MPDTANNDQPIAAGLQPSAQTTPDTSYQGAQVAPATPTGTPTPTVPSAPTVPTPTAQPPNTSATNGQSTSTPTAPTPHEALYSKFLKMISPPSRYIDPTGKLQTQPQTGKNIGNNVIAAILSGMMTPTAYRQGEFGPVADTQATAANAFGAGQKQKNDQNDKAQKLSDDMQARKLQAVANNTAAMHSYASMMQAQAAAEKEGAEAEALQTKNWQGIADQNQNTIIASADDYDKNRSTPDAPKARLTSGMTTEELLASPFKDKMTSQLMVQDGTRSEYDPKTGRSHVVPTWTVLNPDVDIKLNQAAVDRAAKINPSFGNNLFENAGGNVRVNLGKFAAITHQINSVDHAEDLLQSIADSKDKDLMSLGIKGNVEGRLSNAARTDPSAMKALMEFENAGAQGGDTADKLNRLLQSGGGDAIFKALGTDRDTVQNYVNMVANRKTSAEALAKQGGQGEKAPAAQDQVKRLVTSINDNTDLTASDKKDLSPDIPTPDKDGVIHMTQGQVEKLTSRLDQTVTANKNRAEKDALDQGNPEVMAKIANNVIEGDINDVAKLASYRGNARMNAINAIHDEAARRGLDTTQFDEASLMNKTQTINDFGGNKKGSTGAQIGSFNAFLGHTAGAVDAEKRLEGKTIGLTRSPWINTAMDTLGKQVTNDPDWKAYQTSLLPVQNEISNFLAAGYATKEEDTRLMKSVLDPHETPSRVTAALRQLAETADVRLAEMGRRYLDTIGATYPRLLSPDSANTLKRLNITSKAIPVSVPLSRGWNNGQPTRLDPKAPQNQPLMKRFLAAANNDPARALDLAKLHGYTF